MGTHNPKQVIEQLQIILSNPAKKIGFLFGAGISAKDKDGIVSREVLTQKWTDWIDYWSVECVPGRRKVAVKLVGIFGNDTMKIIELTIGGGR